VGRFRLALSAAAAIVGEEDLDAAERHPDVKVLDPDAGIDGIRDLLDAFHLRPARADRQVLVVRDFDRMSDAAHNALLKLLEEPPGGAAVYLVVEDAALLPETVVSRCRVVPVAPLSAEETAAVLERLGLPRELARDVEGSPGRAVFAQAAGAFEDAERLVALLDRPSTGALAEADALARKRGEEDGKGQRRRLAEALRLAAARLRRDLPGREGALRAVVSALASLEANASPGITLAELALTPWRERTLR
jgi:hypothetical protein